MTLACEENPEENPNDPLQQRLRELEVENQKLREEVDSRSRLHEREVIERDVRSAAQQLHACNADQLLPYLLPKAKVVKRGERHVAVIDDQPIRAAIEAMKQIPEHKNFFRDLMEKEKQGEATRDARTMDMDEYMRVRREDPKSLGLSPKKY